MLDLNKVQARYTAAMNPHMEAAVVQYDAALTCARDVPALVAELRAAREVINALQKFDARDDWECATAEADATWRGVAVELDAYARVAGDGA